MYRETAVLRIHVYCSIADPDPPMGLLDPDPDPTILKQK
jgi:hypothetical protein